MPPTCGSPPLGKLLADGKILTDSAVLASKGVITADLGLVSTAFAQKYPDLVTKYIKLQDKAYQLFKSQPDTKPPRRCPRNWAPTKPKRSRKLRNWCGYRRRSRPVLPTWAPRPPRAVWPRR